MIEHKLNKEGWVKGGMEFTSEPDSTGAFLNVTPARKPKKEKPMSKADLVNMDPGRSSMGGPTHGW
jgi:hypothetical protein